MPDRRFHPLAARALVDAIRENGGDEVFAIGHMEPHTGAGKARVARVEVVCRGTADRVPALLSRPRPGQIVLHNHPSGDLRPSEADLQLAGRYGEEGVGVVIVNNDVTQSRWVVEPHRREPVALDEDEVARVFTEALPRAMPGHEPRGPQVEMARQVARALSSGRQDARAIRIIEAGTGTGKSLAYLVPAAMWAKANDSRVVIATHTLTLQGQLATSDLPVLARAGLDVRWAVLRGRSNYLCRRRLAEAAAEVGADANKDVQERIFEDPPGGTDYSAEARRNALVELVAFAEQQARHGHRQALPFPIDSEVWEDVRSDHDQTLRARCPHFDRCFYYSARREAADAHLLVVNHHLLLADLALKAESGGEGVLPPFDRLILDEGHHLESAATSLLREQLTTAAITRQVSRLTGTKRRKGTLHRLFSRFASPSSPLPEIERDRFRRTTAELLATLPRLSELARTNLEGIENTVLDAHTPSWRLTPEHCATPEWTATVQPAIAELAGRTGEAARRLDRLADLLDGLPPSDRMAEPQPVFDLGRAHRLLGGHARLAGELAQGVPEPDETGAFPVRWLERSRGRGTPSATLVSAPVDVGPILRKQLFEALATTVVTSATLAVRGTFDHYRSRVGLAELPAADPHPTDDDIDLDAILGDLGAAGAGPTQAPAVHTALLASPFNYAQQAVLALPRDLPPPDAPTWAHTIARATSAALHVSRGGAFVLCTSFDMIERLHAHAQGVVGGRMLLLRQGEMGRGRLLQRFRDTPNAVLFGTDSFWEGVSVKGDALRLVVIPRLPFRVPTEPVQQARSELLEARGKNPFRAHMLPEAVLKLRQGFGRLIRTRTDRGAVLILDRRIHDRWYGRVFLQSLPPARRITGPTRAVLAQMRDFLRAGQPPNPTGLAPHSPSH